MKDKQNVMSFIQNNDIILMQIGMVIAFLSPLAGLAYNQNGGLNAFFITCIPLGIGSVLLLISLHYGSKEQKVKSVE